jgi:ABC-2 type transport system permease protein
MSVKSKIQGSFYVYQREIKEAFTGPFIYVLTALFSALMGWLFFNYIVQSKEPTNLTLSQTILMPLFGNMASVLIFFMPLLTMKTFSEEKKRQTLDLLRLSGVGHYQIIIAKLLSTLSIVGFMMSFTLLFPIILAYSGYSDWSTVGVSYLGLFFTALCYTSVGLFTSSLTSNQILAAIGSFCILLALVLFVFSAHASENYLLGLIFQYLSMPYHFEGLVRGVLSSFSVVYVLSFVILFLYITEKSLKAKSI